MSTCENHIPKELPKLRLDWCSAKAARWAVEHWHYSHKMPVNKLVKIGVWEDDKFVGVIIFGLGASAHIHYQFQVEQTEVCELVRIALGEHKVPVSKMIPIAIRMLKKSNPGIRVIVSFADPAEGHHGGIYQATNWIYTGMSLAVRQYFYNGDWRHATDVCKRLTRAQRSGLQRRIKPGKHRYVMPLDREMRKLVEASRKEYPKRTSVAIGGVE